jgi:hypothetical protein
MTRQHELRIKQKAIEVYGTFTPQERTVVRFGMLPAGKTERADAELMAEFEATDGVKPNPVELARLLAVALMDVANAGPDKLVV